MKINSDFEFQIKMVIIGDSGVGKTNFIFQFTEGRFSPLHVSTVGFDFKSRTIELPKSKKKVKLQIWDTAGQERYMALNKNLFQKVQAIILMYDLTDRNSYENIINWLYLVNQTISNKLIILIANKLDLAEEKRIVSEEEAQKFAKDNHLLFFEGSGSTGENVDQIFTTIAEKIYKNLMDYNNENNTLQLNSKKAINKRKKCC